MSAHPEDFLRDRAQVDHNSIQPLPNSRKIYVTGSRPDLRVPMREVTLSDTPTAFGGEPNPPVLVYETPAPNTDRPGPIVLPRGRPPTGRPGLKNGPVPGGRGRSAPDSPGRERWIP